MAKIDVIKVAKLANLSLSKREEKLYQKQLEEILSYVDQIEEKIKAADEEPTFNVTLNKNVTQEDIPNTSLTQKETLQNGSKSKDGFFITGGIFENE